MTLDRKIDFALNLLRNIPQDGPIELSYSGGKDNDVILELAKMAGIPFEAIYKNTTIDPPGTIAHCKANGVKIMAPRKSFFQIVEEKSMPSRFSRFCCAELKEYKIYGRAIQGIRRQESTARAKRYKEPEYCRTYNKREKARIYLPILEWTLEDVTSFIEMRGIKCAPTYYDADGTFHPERRLGCIGCPLASDNGRSEFLQSPKLLKRIIKAQRVFLDNHKDSRAYMWFDGNAHNAIFRRLFCNTMADFQNAVHPPMFSNELSIDTKEFLENYFGIDLTI